MTHPLPLVDERGFCNVLLAAIGGEGANRAGKLLFDLAVEDLELDGGFDARYGSEKKGTATDVSIRLCSVGTPIRFSGPTQRPHILVAFHDWLIAPQQLHRGLHADARVIVNSTIKPDDLRTMMALHSGAVTCLDATSIALETGSRLNIPLSAALAKELGFPLELLRARIEALWPFAAESNLPAFDQALESLVRVEYPDDGSYLLTDPASEPGPLGFLTMLNGGAINARYHSTVHRRVRLAGHGWVPEVVPESCTGCALCIYACSDPGALVFEDGKLISIDAEFCKGCMRCVHVCPQTRTGTTLTIPEDFQDVG